MKIDLSFQNRHKEFDKFWVLKSLKNFDFNGLLLSKVYTVWAKKVQRSYLSWNSRGIQNLERSRQVLSKLTWGIWHILTWELESLKNFRFNGLLLSKVHIVWAKKLQRRYLSWYWRVIQNLKENWLVVWKMTWGIWQIFTRALEIVKNWNFNGILLSKEENLWA